MVDNSQTKTGDTADNITTFTSADSTTATAWTDVNVMTSGETHKSFFNKISTMFKNIRFLYNKLGTTDISSIGDGTVTNALSTLNSNLNFHLPKNIEYTYTDIETMFNDADKLINVFDVSKCNALSLDWTGNDSPINATILVVKVYNLRNFALGMETNGNALFYTSFHSAASTHKWYKLTGTTLS